MATDDEEKLCRLQENNSRKLAQQWQQCNDVQSLQATLFKYWSSHVPNIYTIDDEAEVPTQDNTGRDLIFSPLEWFICSGSDPKVVFKKLKQEDDPPKLCGRVFKMGEPTYSCRDCAVDPTCVFCIDCFQKSAHRTHRYRMSTSGGGGFCDCGDVEAWKQNPSCEIHTVNSEQSTKSPLERLPAEMKSKTEILFHIALNYAYDLLIWEQCDTLPHGLQPSVLADSYCTMLFNDEVHTYDQVIDTLKKAVDCTHKEAVDFATVVDREGRSSVCNGNFRICEQACSIIKRNTSRHGNKALKVHVMHTSVVAHHTFAMRLLSWLTEIIAHSEGLRQLLCVECMKPYRDTNKALIEHVILSDTKLWKVARIHWHQLIMSSVLIDQEFKKQFAMMYTKNYNTLQRDFITLDDHDHSVSITSLSVQMFTVPTLSRMLIMECDLLSEVLNTFMSFCGPDRRAEGRLKFDRNSLQQNFRRIQYILLDLRYILSSIPNEWESKLKEKFLKGLNVFLELLSAIQGMDAVTRQVALHIEVEPEWETAFNLQIKLGSCITMLLEWCATDRSVLVEAYRATMKILRSISGSSKLVKKKISGHDCSCIVYDVATQPVTVHSPLSRFLAGLHVSLQKYRISYYSEGFLPNMPLSPAEMIEEAMHTQVMISQVQAGMWRRNGYSLLNQIYYYHNVRCRSEMQDRDILMLQIGAMLMNPNEFVITVLNKYGLINVMKENADKLSSEDSQKQVHIETLIEEFLLLLIVVLGERYAAGVGQVSHEDRVKREVIHQLCIGPMPHSELAKSLTENHNHETGLETVITSVATFKKPGATGKGLYELKREFYKDYNPFFYHYSKADQSKAEETQRKMKKSNGEGEALPPPVPPPFTSTFKSVSSVLQCDVMIHVLSTILRRASLSRIRGWTETMIQRVLYLVGMALHEEKCHHNNHEDFGFIAKATAGPASVLSLLESLAKIKRVEEHKDLLGWVLKTFAEVQQLKGSEITSVEVQKDLDAEAEKKRKSELAKQRRARIMAQMSAMQRNFIKENAELFEATETELDSDVSATAMDTSEILSDFPVAVGAKRSKATEQGVTKCTCILCQEDEEVTLDGRAMVLASLVQRSTVLSKSRGKVIGDAEKFDAMFVPPDLYYGTHVSTCGHIMHWDCWQRFFESVVAKEQRRPHRFRAHLSFDVDKREFLCPLCESLSNAVIPLLPHPGTSTSQSQDSICDEKPASPEVSYNEWLAGIQSILQASQESALRQKQQQEEEMQQQQSSEENSLSDPCPLPTLTKMMAQTMAQTVAENFQLLFEYVYSIPSQFSDSVKDMIKMFARSLYMVGLGLMPFDEDERVPVVAWTTCAYTIHSVENLLREEAKPLFGSLSSRQNECLGALVRFAAACGNITNTTACRKHALRLLSAMTAMTEVADLPCILDIDMFTLMVNVCLSIPLLNCEDSVCNSSTHVSGEAINHHWALKVTLTAHILQILFTSTFQTSDEEMELEDRDEAQKLLEIYKNLHTTAGNKLLTVPSPWQLLCQVKKACLPFLRCAAMFFHFLNGIASPAELQNVGIDEFEPLCQYLAMPTDLSQLFDNEGAPQMQTIIERWCQHPAITTKMSVENQGNLVRYPLEVNQLIELPQDYSQLINTISLFMCPKSSGSDSRAPTLCLVCGETLCSQSYCCQKELDNDIVGACMAHTYTCGAGVGVFLRVRECQLILLSGKNKGCFFTPPYLDDYGETDQGLRRGNPLHLCQDRYRKLQKLWLLHGIPEEIAHQLESNNSLQTIDWQNL